MVRPGFDQVYVHCSERRTRARQSVLWHLQGLTLARHAWGRLLRGCPQEGKKEVMLRQSMSLAKKLLASELCSRLPFWLCQRPMISQNPRVQESYDEHMHGLFDHTKQLFLVPARLLNRQSVQWFYNLRVSVITPGRSTRANCAMSELSPPPLHRRVISLRGRLGRTSVYPFFSGSGKTFGKILRFRKSARVWSSVKPSLSANFRKCAHKRDHGGFW